MSKLGFRRPRLLTSCEGGVALLFAIAAPVFVAGTLGAMDVMQLLNVGTALQDSADAAALAAGKLATAGGTDADAGREASAMVATDFASTGLGAGQPTASTRVDRTGPVKATVVATAPVTLFFASVLGTGRALSRTAVAVSNAGDPVCLLILSPSAAAAWSMQGTSNVRGANCVSQVNSNSAQALSRNGNAGADMLAVYVAGPAQAAPGFNPAPTFGAPVLQDKIAPKIAWPAAGGCTYTDLSVTHSAQTLSPGTYCGGLSVSTHGIANLSPGLYVIRDGDLSVTSHGALSAPSDVTIVLLGETSTITVQGGGALQVSAPRSGAWANLALVQKPQSVERTSDLQGGGSMDVDGVVYLPSQKLSLTGGGSSTAAPRRVLVVNTLQTQGNGQIDLAGDPTILAAGGGVRLAH